MLKNEFNENFLDSEIKWCLESGLLPNTRYTVEGNSRNNIYSKREIENIFTNLIDQLFESKKFIAGLKKKTEFTAQLDVVKNETKKEGNINECLEGLSFSLSFGDVTGVDILHALMCDIMVILKFQESKLMGIVDNEGECELLPAKEFIPFKVFRTLVNMIIKNGVKNAESIEAYNAKMDERWIDSLYIDRELVELMNHGSASGILNRMRMILSNNRVNMTNKDFKNSEGYLKVKGTLIFAMETLPTSRQIVFTRVLNHLARLINIDRDHLYSYLVVKKEYNLNNVLWNLIYRAISDSGIRRLYYDDYGFIKQLEKLKSKDLSVSRLFKILKYKECSYVGSEEDYERTKEDVETQTYFENLNEEYKISHFAKLVFQTKGVGAFESEQFKI